MQKRHIQKPTFDLESKVLLIFSIISTLNAVFIQKQYNFQQYSVKFN